MNQSTMTLSDKVIRFGDVSGAKATRNVPDMAGNEFSLLSDERLSLYALKLYTHYQFVCREQPDHVCVESVRTTARKCDMSIGSVVRWRKELEDLNLIRVVKKGRKYTVRVLEKNEAKSQRKVVQFTDEVADSRLGEMLIFYEYVFGLEATEELRDRLESWSGVLDKEWVWAGFALAEKYKAHSFAFVERVWSEWQMNGRDNMTVDSYAFRDKAYFAITGMYPSYDGAYSDWVIG